MASPTVLVVGNSTLKLTLHIKTLPEAGETVFDDGGIAYLPTGAGAEVASAFSALGARAVLLTKLGRDAHGKKLFDYYKSLGIDTSQIKVDPQEVTGTMISLETADAPSRRIIYPGAMAKITEQNVKDALDAVRPDAVFLTFDAPLPLLEMVANEAYRRAIPIFADPATTNDFSFDHFPPMEIFFPNEKETEAYTGVLPQGVDVSLRASLTLFRKIRTKYLILKMGARGSFFYDGKHCDVVAPPPQIKLKPTANNLGAMYCASFVVCYLGGAEIKACMRYATASAILLGSRGGDMNSYPTQKEIIAFCTEHKI